MRLCGLLLLLLLRRGRAGDEIILLFFIPILTGNGFPLSLVLEGWLCRFLRLPLVQPLRCIALGWLLPVGVKLWVLDAQV